MRLMIINGSVREGRRSDTVQNWIVPLLQQDTELELDIVDLKEVDLPFFDEPKSPDASGGQYNNPKGTAWAQRVAKADAFLLLVAEYNHGPTAVLKNAIDWVYDGWVGKPVGFVSYGGMVGGARAVEQLKQIVLHVQMSPISTAVHIPGIGNAFDEKGQPKYEGLNESLKNLVHAIKERQQQLAH